VLQHVTVVHHGAKSALFGASKNVILVDSPPRSTRAGRGRVAGPKTENVQGGNNVPTIEPQASRARASVDFPAPWMGQPRNGSYRAPVRPPIVYLRTSLNRLLRSQSRVSHPAFNAQWPTSGRGPSNTGRSLGSRRPSVMCVLRLSIDSWNQRKSSMRPTAPVSRAPNSMAAKRLGPQTTDRVGSERLYFRRDIGSDARDQRQFLRQSRSQS